MIPDNACTLRITAAAGTELAGAYSYGTVNHLHVGGFLPVQKRFTTHRAVFPHAAWLDQAPAHCPIFLTAASRRSLVRVSVPVWGISLSGPLPIVAMVSRYLTIQLMGRIPIHYRSLYHRNHAAPMDHGGLIQVSPGYTPVVGRLYTRYAPVRRSPPGTSTRAAPRLACVRPAASVHPEPGSNSSSSLLVILPRRPHSRKTTRRPTMTQINILFRFINLPIPISRSVWRAVLQYLKERPGPTLAATRLQTGIAASLPGLVASSKGLCLSR